MASQLFAKLSPTLAPKAMYAESAASGWKRLSAGFGSKGERLHEWALIPLSKQDGWARALLVRRSIEEKPECAYYLCYAPSGKDTIETLVRVIGQRWLIEQSFEMAKGECGLDHYEVRHWQGWYRHITLSMLAHAVLPALRARGEKTPDAHMRLSVPELRHLLTALLWRGWHGVEHLLHWSKWRRRHQFRAMRCHYRTARIDSAELLSATVVPDLRSESHSALSRAY